MSFDYRKVGPASNDWMLGVRWVRCTPSNRATLTQEPELDAVDSTKTEFE